MTLSCCVPAEAWGDPARRKRYFFIDKYLSIKISTTLAGVKLFVKKISDSMGGNSPGGNSSCHGGPIWYIVPQKAGAA
jgi:hypothetical protein